MRTVQIGPQAVGPGEPSYVVAEAGVNHDGDESLALQLVDAAVRAGADAVKFQVFRADKAALPSAPKAAYQQSAGPSTESQHDMLRRLELPDGAFERIQAHCVRRGITFFASPFDRDSAVFLHGIDVPVFKISSGELDNHPLLEVVGGYHRPIILSTGMSTLDDVGEAVEVLRESGCGEIVLLHCVSSYPAAAADCNLRAMATMRERFDVPVGFSDHTIGSDTAVAAVAAGACMIEKHLTLSRDMPGPDHRASCEPHELAELIRRVRDVEQALGDGIKRRRDAEASVEQVARRSLVVVADLPAGTIVEPAHLDALRPAGGLSPREFRRVVGMRTTRFLAAGTVLSEEDLTEA